MVKLEPCRNCFEYHLPSDYCAPYTVVSNGPPRKYLNAATVLWPYMAVRVLIGVLALVGVWTVAGWLW